MTEPSEHTTTLTERAELLTKQVGDLTMQVEQLNCRAGEVERRGIRSAYALVFLAMLLVFGGMLVWQQRETSARLEGVVQSSLCPVYALVVGGYDPTSRPLNTDGTYEGSPREKYVQNAAVMDEAYRALGCRGGLVPPRTTP